MLKSFHLFSNYFIEASVKITAMTLCGKRSLPLMSAKNSTAMAYMHVNRYV